MQKGFLTFQILIVISFLVLVLGVGYLVGNKSAIKYEFPNSSVERAISQSNIFKNDCNYKILKPAEYLPTYMVQKGDSLLRLSTVFLGTSSRINEIVNLNIEYYPNFRDDYELEIGQILYLPPKFAFPSSGYIWGYSGEIIDEADDFWEIRTVNIDKDPLDTKFYKKSETKYFGKDAFRKNDCVSIIFDGEDNSVIAISVQDPQINYFEPSTK